MNCIVISICIVTLSLTASCDSNRSKDRATAKQCDQLAEKWGALADTSMREDIGETKESNALITAIIKDTKAVAKMGCMKKYSRDRATCALAAPDLEAMANCPPTKDLRAPDDRPSSNDCKRLGEHLQGLYENSAPAPLDLESPDAGLEDTKRNVRRREAIIGMVANSVRECSWTMTKAYASCLMRATSVEGIIECSPNRIKMPNVDAFLGEALGEL